MFYKWGWIWTGSFSGSHQRMALPTCCLVLYLTAALSETRGALPATQLWKNGRNVNDSASVSVNLTHVVHEVSDQFLSVTIDASAIRSNWAVINFTSPRVINMAKALSPAMLRVGGTSGDFIIFDNKEIDQGKGPTGCAGLPPPDRSNFTLNTTQWDKVNTFVMAASWDFIYGLNLLLRHPWPNGSWDSSNAEQLMEYTVSKGYQVNWELGNEPDLFSKFAPNIPVSPEQNAKDFATLRALVTAKSPTSKFVVGPDTAYDSYMNHTHDYYGKFLQSIQDRVINAATWHNYYTDGQTATLPDFFNVTLLDNFIAAAKTAQGLVEQYRPDVELWLGETSSCSGGGAPALSNAYIAGFMWLDKLGIAALTNHTRVFRQTFVGGDYSLLDSGLYPLPDYWLSALYKKLVGTRVLLVENSLESGRYVRAYAHCAKFPSPSGSVVLLLLNLNTYDTNATLVTQELISSSRDVYWLTPLGGTANITSHEVLLNGHLLRLDGDTLPDLEPEEQKNSDTIFLPALSFGYYIFKDAKAAACM